MRTIKQILKTILKYRLSSSLTILSIVITFLGIIILSLYVNYHSSFNKFHKKVDDIAILSYNHEMGSAMPVPMAKLIKDNIPEIEKTVTLRSSFWVNNLKKKNQNKKDAISVEVLDATKDFFTVFDFPLLVGDHRKVLEKDGDIVISESLSKKIFGTTDVVGKQVWCEDVSFNISGVMKDMPQNSDLRKDAVLSISKKDMEEWSEWSYMIFFKLKKGVSKEHIISKIKKIEEVKEFRRQIIESFSEDTAKILLLPLKTMHYKSNSYFINSMNEKVLDVMVVLIVILLVMGAVNFINFSSSQAPLRAKSLSIQQILGEKKVNARMQIVGESVFLSVFAMGIAFLIHNFIYEGVESLFEIKSLSFEGYFHYYLIFLLFAVVFGIMAGAYPSKYITSAPISQVVKGKMFFSGKGKGFRNILITLQFTFAIMLISSSLIIEKQLEYWNNFDIGINKESVLYMKTSVPVIKSYKEFGEELLKNKDITNYTYTQFLPGEVGMGWGREVEGKQVSVKCWPIDDRFLDFFDIKMSKGRKFNSGKGDINNFIVNEKAVQRYDWQKPLDMSFPGFDFSGKVVGVSKNFNFSSLKEEIEPMIFWRTDSRKSVILIKTKPTSYNKLREYIEKTAQRFDPETTFEVKFLDDFLEKLYNKEQKVANFIKFIAIWTILLSLIGLLGLIIFIQRDKVKEIGIRKVNGATVFDIMLFLNKNIVIWILIAFVIATPISYWAMKKWLEGFAYKTELSVWVFVISGVITLLLSLIVVSFHSYRTARLNPSVSMQ